MKKVELCWDAEHLQNVKNLLEGYVPGVSPAKLLLASPSLLLLPLPTLEGRLRALEEVGREVGREGGKEKVLEGEGLVRLLTLCPRILKAEAEGVRRGVRSIRAGLEGGGEGGGEGENGQLNVLQLANKCPTLLLKAVEGLDVEARVREWNLAFGQGGREEGREGGRGGGREGGRGGGREEGGIDTRALLRKHPVLLLLEFKAILQRFKAFERGLSLPPSLPPSPPPLPLRPHRLLLLRKAPLLLTEDPPSLFRRARQLLSLLGPADALHLARRYPRIFLKDFARNLTPKGRWLAGALGPPVTLPSLLRTSPQVFFYSSSSLQIKAARLRRALPPSLDLLRMLRTFPGLACMDVEKNVLLKIRYLMALFQGGKEGGEEGGGEDEVLRMIERDPRVLVHGFGRMSRAEYVVREGGREGGREEGREGRREGGPQNALRAVGMRWEEMETFYPGYVQSLLDDEGGMEGGREGGGERGAGGEEGNEREEGEEEEVERGEEREGEGGEERGYEATHLTLLEAKRGKALKARLTAEFSAENSGESGEEEKEDLRREGERLLPGRQEVFSNFPTRKGEKARPETGRGAGRKELDVGEGEVNEGGGGVEKEAEVREGRKKGGGGWVRKTSHSEASLPKGFVIAISKGGGGDEE
jgi:hypothetical protein